MKAGICKIHEVKEANSPKVADGLDSFMSVKYTAFYISNVRLYDKVLNS